MLLRLLTKLKLRGAFKLERDVQLDCTLSEAVRPSRKGPAVQLYLRAAAVALLVVQLVVELKFNSLPALHTPAQPKQDSTTTPTWRRLPRSTGGAHLNDPGAQTQAYFMKV